MSSYPYYSFFAPENRLRGGTDMHHREHHKIRVRPLPEYISVISATNCAKIRIDDIEVIEQDGRKLHVVTSGKDYSFYGGLNTIAESLAERAFFRPIKKMIINLDHVRDISGYYVNFNSGQSIAMGRNALANTKKAYKRYLLRYPPYSLWEPVAMADCSVAEKSDVENEA
jgi:hypothetical protein